MKKIFIEVSEQEEELLAAIRNYNKSFPDGYPELLWYAQRLFDNMLRQPYEWKRNPPYGEGTLKQKNNNQSS